MHCPLPWTVHGREASGASQDIRYRLLYKLTTPILYKPTTPILYKLTTPILYKLTVPTFWVPPAPPSNISAATIQEHRANTQKKKFFGDYLGVIWGHLGFIWVPWTVQPAAASYLRNGTVSGIIIVDVLD